MVNWMHLDLASLLGRITSLHQSIKHEAPATVQSLVALLAMLTMCETRLRLNAAAQRIEASAVVTLVGRPAISQFHATQLMYPAAIRK